MTAAEEGVLLLCSRLGDPDCKPLTTPQFRKLGLLVMSAASGGDPTGTLRQQDLMALGCTEDQAAHILHLLNREPALRRYLARGEKQDIFPLTRLSAAYPARLRQYLGSGCPPVLFYRGDLTLLAKPAMAVIGSRQLRPANEAFARRAGQLLAENQLVLVSGGAIGADQAAQEACLNAGGSCILVVPDQLEHYPPHRRILYLSTDGYDLPFSTPRALLRNHLIHILASQVLVAQCRNGSGGTWQGCTENLRRGWSDIFVYQDHTDGAAALLERGASPLPAEFQLSDLQKQQLSLF